jgi:hypothetical protein
MCGYLTIRHQLLCFSSRQNHLQTSLFCATFEVTHVQPVELRVQWTEAWITFNDISLISGPTTRPLSPHLPQYAFAAFVCPGRSNIRTFDVLYKERRWRALTEFRGQAVFLFQNREVLVSDLGQKTEYPDNLSWLSSVPPDNCCEPILQKIDSLFFTSCPIHNSTIVLPLNVIHLQLQRM